MNRRTLRMITTMAIAAITVGASAPLASASEAQHARVKEQQTLAPLLASEQRPLTDEQREFLDHGMGPEGLAAFDEAVLAARDGGVTYAFPIAAVAIAAAAWCARGAVASVPTSVLSDIAAGKMSSKGTYARNAIIGCLGGEIGGFVWKWLPGWVKNKAVALVASFIIRYIR